MLKKQSIRKEHTIYLGGVKMEKEEIIEISKDFTEKELLRFKKMLQQGGSIKIKGLSYDIIRNESKPRNSRGEYESPIKLMDKE